MKIETYKNRKPDIKLKPFDTWSMDYTLAPIILALLKQLKKTQHGAPRTDNADVPKKYQIDNVSIHGADKKYFKRWNYILKEMIWTFTQLSDEICAFDNMGLKNNKRIANGLRLFGKYYRGLWD